MGMFPHERSLVAKLQNKPFALVGVNSDESPEEYKKVVEQHQLTWRSFFDGGEIGGPIATQWGVNGWPTIYILDKQGVIRYQDLRDAKMEEAVMALLAE
ncbi:MAG: TlpA family protein disulfide reductase [Planctomycetota bacterium]